jgi:lipoprotein-releasing system ATP-binding protein
MNEPVLRLVGISRGFAQGRDRLRVLDGAGLEVSRGEIVALVGPSGAGKSTLLHIAGLLEAPDQGEVWLNGENCGTLSDDARTRLRRRDLGFVYQYHHLLPEFSALENIILPQMIAGARRGRAALRGKELLARMNLSAREAHRPGQLSGGEQQRVAIARAMANEPALLLADEPTGNLDPHTADLVFAQMLESARESGLAALIATHNPELARRMDRVIRLTDGKLVEAAK